MRLFEGTPFDIPRGVNAAENWRTIVGALQHRKQELRPKSNRRVVIENERKAKSSLSYTG